MHNGPAKLISLVIAVLLWLYVNYKKLPERSFTIPIALNSMPKELSLMESYINVVKVKIKGPEDVIQTYLPAHFSAYVDLKKAGRGQNYLPVKVQTLKKNKRLRIVSILPSEIAVSLDKFIMKELPVSPVIVNTPAEGYVRSEETYYPKNITVKGPARIVGEMNALLTKPVDIGGVTGSIYKEVELDLPNEFITPYDFKTVHVSVKIRENFRVWTLSRVRIAVKGLAGNLKLANREPITARLTLRGPAEKQNELGNETELLFLDLEEVKQPGIYKKSVSYNIPWNCRVLKIEPERINVIVEGNK